MQNTPSCTTLHCRVISEVDDGGTIVRANLTAAKMLGRVRSTLIGSRLALLCMQASRIGLREHIEKVLAESASQNCELEFLGPDNEPFTVRLDSNRVQSSNDTDRWNCRMIMADITRRTEAEAALRESEKHLNALANAVPVLIGYVDTDLNFQFSNAAYQEWFGFTPGSLHGKSLQNIFGPESSEETSDYLADVMAGHQVEFESSLQHRKKGRRHVQVMFVPELDSSRNVTGIHILCTDITERKVVEKQNSRRLDFSERLIRLNASERDVYELLIRGMSNKAIASELDVGLRTAERRRRIILEKLEISSIAELLQQLADIQGIRPL